MQWGEVSVQTSCRGASVANRVAPLTTPTWGLRHWIGVCGGQYVAQALVVSRSCRWHPLRNHPGRTMSTLSPPPGLVDRRARRRTIVDRLPLQAPTQTPPPERRVGTHRRGEFGAPSTMSEEHVAAATARLRARAQAVDFVATASASAVHRRPPAATIDVVEVVPKRVRGGAMIIVLSLLVCALSAYVGSRAFQPPPDLGATAEREEPAARATAVSAPPQRVEAVPTNLGMAAEGLADRAPEAKPQRGSDARAARESAADDARASAETDDGGDEELLLVAEGADRAASAALPEAEKAQSRRAHRAEAVADVEPEPAAAPAFAKGAARDAPAAGDRRERTDSGAGADSSSERRDDAVARRSRQPAAVANETLPRERGGYLTVDSSPYAIVYVDGRKVGETPLVRVELPAGARRVRTVTADGRARSFTVRIGDGQVERRRVVYSE